MANVNKSLLFLLIASVIAFSEGLVGGGPFLKCQSPGIVALTFDDGPSSRYTRQLLDLLKESNITATFFLNGIGNYENDPMRYRETVTRAFNEGHQIGTHSWSHYDMANLTTEEIRDELRTVAVLVEEILGVNMTIFRPPYGSYNDLLIKIAEDDFGYDAIIWNVDTEDWSHPTDIEAGLQHWIDAIEANEAPSYIGLQHDVNSGVVELTRRTIEYVWSKNFTIVTIAECIGGDMYQL